VFVSCLPPLLGSCAATTTMVNGIKPNTFDLLRQFSSSVINFFNRREYVVSPTDGGVLKLYYKYTFWLLMSGFAVVYYNWYTRDIIVCASHFNADSQVRIDYLNICSTFPYIMIGDTVKYLLYYKWVHWVLFLSALAFYIPHKMAKKPFQHRLTRLLDTINNCVIQYDSAEQTLINTVTKYLIQNRKRQDNLYFRYLLSNIAALFICITIFFLYDIMLLNKFKSLGYDAYPYTRDGEHLTDALHQAFPPFAKCDIGMNQQLMNRRQEAFGCHLTAQEFYEKLFLGLWVVFMLLMIISSLYTLFLLGFFIKPFRKFLVKMICKVKDEKIDQTIENATENFGIGDWFLLYKLRGAFFNHGFHQLLQRLGSDDVAKKLLDSSKRCLPQLPHSTEYNTPKKKWQGLLVE